MHDSTTRKKCGGLRRRRRQSVANDGECRRDATPFPSFSYRCLGKCFLRFWPAYACQNDLQSRQTVCRERMNICRYCKPLNSIILLSRPRRQSTSSCSRPRENPRQLQASRGGPVLGCSKSVNVLWLTQRRAEDLWVRSTALIWIAKEKAD